MNNLRKLLSTPLWYYPEFRQITGSTAAAIILQRLLYLWERKQNDTIYKSVKELQAETGFAKDEQWKAIKELEKLEFIDMEYAGMPPVRHFKISVDKVRKAIEEHFDKKMQQNGRIAD